MLHLQTNSKQSIVVNENNVTLNAKLTAANDSQQVLGVTCKNRQM
jgi:hypothetical protein